MRERKKKQSSSTAAGQHLEESTREDEPARARMYPHTHLREACRGGTHADRARGRRSALSGGGDGKAHAKGRIRGNAEVCLSAHPHPEAT